MKKTKSDITEGMTKKGGLNDKPIGDRPLPPKGQIVSSFITKKMMNLRNEIASTWGENGAHVELFDSMLNQTQKPKTTLSRESIEKFLNSWLSTWGHKIGSPSSMDELSTWIFNISNVQHEKKSGVSCWVICGKCGFNNMILDEGNHVCENCNADIHV